MSPKLPKAWPDDISYVRKPVYAKALTPQQRSSLVSTREDIPAVKYQTPNQNSVIRKINDDKHPAHGQCGLFAAQPLAPQKFILPYLGHVHGEMGADESSDYDLRLDRDLGISVDAAAMGNEARFINDYRGVPRATGPNAEFKDTWIDVGHNHKEKVIGVYILPAGKSGKRSSGIQKGDEILVSYGKGFWSSRLHDAL